MGIGVGCDVDGVDLGGQQVAESGGHDGDGKFRSIGSRAVGVAAPDSGEGGVFDSLKSVGEAGGGAAWADDAEANGLLGLTHGNRVARLG